MKKVKKYYLLMNGGLRIDNITQNKIDNIEDKINIKCSEYKSFDNLTIINEVIDNIIVIGDVHGDIKLVKRILTYLKIIDENDEWIGGNTHIVQVGDQIDSMRHQSHSKCFENEEPNDITVLIFFTELHKKAKLYGGRVISLLGNHEIMNVMGYLKYVSPRNRDLIINNNDRVGQFKRGGEFSKLLACSRQSFVIINDILFIHAGIVNKIMELYDIQNRDDMELYNKIIKLWLLGDIELMNDFLLNPDNIYWTRQYGSRENVLPAKNTDITSPCTDFKKVSEKLNIGHMIIGHTPQQKINSICSNKIWRVDVGNSYAFNVYKTYSINTITDASVLQIKTINNEKEFMVIEKIT